MMISRCWVNFAVLNIVYFYKLTFKSSTKAVRLQYLVRRDVIWRTENGVHDSYTILLLYTSTSQSLDCCPDMPPLEMVSWIIYTPWNATIVFPHTSIVGGCRLLTASWPDLCNCAIIIVYMASEASNTLAHCSSGSLSSRSLFRIACISSYICPSCWSKEQSATWSSMSPYLPNITHHSSSRSSQHPSFRQSKSRPPTFAHTSAIPSRIQSAIVPISYHPTSSRVSFQSTGKLTICTGFSTFLWALNSAFMYSSPSNRISLGRCFRCARNSLLYKGIGGSNANGAGLKPLAVPAAVGVAINNRGCILILFH